MFAYLVVQPVLIDLLDVAYLSILRGFPKFSSTHTTISTELAGMKIVFNCNFFRD